MTAARRTEPSASARHVHIGAMYQRRQRITMDRDAYRVQSMLLDGRHQDARRPSTITLALRALIAWC